jgi:hypothetical protein
MLFLTFETLKTKTPPLTGEGRRLAWLPTSGRLYQTPYLKRVYLICSDGLGAVPEGAGSMLTHWGRDRRCVSPGPNAFDVDVYKPHNYSGY